MKNLTMNEQTGIVLNFLIILVGSIIAFTIYRKFIMLRVVTILAISDLIVLIYLINKTTAISHGELPGSSFELDIFYELHIGVQFAWGNHIQVIDWLIETLKVIGERENKDIVFDVSASIIKEEKVLRLFGEECTNSKPISLFMRIYNVEMIFCVWLLNTFFGKNYPYVKRKNMYRYVIDGEQFNPNKSLLRAMKLKARLMEYKNRHINSKSEKRIFQKNGA